MYWIIFALIVAMLAYIRLAPSDLARWNRPAPHKDVTEKRLKGGYIRRLPVADGKEALARIDQIISMDPATNRLTGSVEDGMITYVTRSRWIGFPDYTTISLRDGAEGQEMEIFSRLRFGRSDFGVNAKRARGWLSAFERG